MLYQQPHLVPPMRLTVFDSLPPTPGLRPQSQLSQWMTQGRNLASRASERASVSIKKKASMRPLVRNRGAAKSADDLPMRRHREFRPLELSIYLSANRLSDLPQFDLINFTESGEIAMPPRALLRCKSEEVFPPSFTVPLPRKPASMFEQHITQAQLNRKASIVSYSRPPSEHDALRSHPVSWFSLPGIPGLVHQPLTDYPARALTPMEEESTPPATAVVVEEMTLDFPRTETQPRLDRVRTPPLQLIAPETVPRIITGSPTVVRMPPYGSQTQSASSTASHTRTPASGSSVSTVSTVATSTTTMSFAEHRLKRSQFYQLQQQQPQQQEDQQQSCNFKSSPAGPPAPLHLTYPHPCSQQAVQDFLLTSSTIDTVETSIMAPEISPGLNTAELESISSPKNAVQMSVSVASNPKSLHVRGKSSTTLGQQQRQYGAEGHRHRADNDMPPCYDDVALMNHIIKEIGTGVQPRDTVGVAF